MNTPNSIVKFFIVLLYAVLSLSSCGKTPVVITDNKSDSDTSSSVRAYAVEADADHEETSDSVTIFFAFAGDIMMGTTYPDEPPGIYLPEAEGRYLYDAVKEILRNADFAAANLEGTFLDADVEAKECDDPDLCYAFKMPEKYVYLLKDAGFDFLSIANNHINDFGTEGLISTQRALSDAGIAFAGLRRDCPSVILSKGGISIGFAAFGHSMGTLNIMDQAEIKRVVQDLRQRCDIVVVSFHGGGEGKKYTHVPHAMERCFGEDRGNVEAFAHLAVDAGADVVYGHGPHVTRALELYNDRLIMYSLGNFCTPFRMNLEGLSGHAPVITVALNQDGSFNEGRIHSFIQRPGKGPQKDLSHTVARNISRLSAEDFSISTLQIDNDGKISKL